MKQTALAAILLLVLAACSRAAGLSVAGASGNWNATGTWASGGTPTSGGTADSHGFQITMNLDLTSGTYVFVDTVGGGAFNNTDNDIGASVIVGSGAAINLITAGAAGYNYLSILSGGTVNIISGNCQIGGSYAGNYTHINNGGLLNLVGGNALFYEPVSIYSGGTLAVSNSCVGDLQQSTATVSCSGALTMNGRFGPATQPTYTWLSAAPGSTVTVGGLRVYVAGDSTDPGIANVVSPTTYSINTVSYTGTALSYASGVSAGTASQYTADQATALSGSNSILSTATILSQSGNYSVANLATGGSNVASGVKWGIIVGGTPSLSGTLVSSAIALSGSDVWTGVSFSTLSTSGVGSLSVAGTQITYGSIVHSVTGTAPVAPPLMSARPDGAAKDEDPGHLYRFSIGLIFGLFAVIVLFVFYERWRRRP